MESFSKQFNTNPSMKNIHVTSVYSVEETIERENIGAVLSIEHPGAEEGKGKAPRLSGVEQEILCFWDTENSQIAMGPSRTAIKKAFQFLDDHRGEKVLIHCKAGKCRSVGVALGWLAKEYGIQPAIDYIKAISPKSAPNLLVVEICDDLCGFNGALTKAMLADTDFTARRKVIRERIGDVRKPSALERR